MTNKTEYVPGELSQAEKRATLENDRCVREQQQAATYMSHTHDDLEVGGRFAKQTPQTVVGATPVPDYPAAFHQHDPVPDEPPLGVDVNELQPMGEVFEVERSIAAQDAPTLEPLPFSAQGNSDDPTAAPPSDPLAGAERVGSSLSSTDDEPPRAA